MGNKPADVLPGTVDMLILKAVVLKLHGYRLLLRIKKISGEAIDLPRGRSTRRWRGSSIGATSRRNGARATTAGGRSSTPLELGSVDVVREDVRASRGLRAVEAILQDVRQAGWALRKAPGFAVTAIGTIALCLGASLAIVAVVDAVLLRGLPFPDADRLVGLLNYPRARVLEDGASITNDEERSGQISALPLTAIYRDGSAVVGESGATREAVTLISPGFFDVLGTSFVTGSVTATDCNETVKGSDPVTSRSDGYG